MPRSPDFIALVLFASACVYVPNANAQACPEEAVTTTPSARRDSAGVASAYQQLQTFAVKEVDLVLIGDSLAQAFDESALSPLSVINLGVGGDKTQNALYRLSSPLWSKIRPRNVVIILGTNNLSSADRPCAIIAGLEKVIARVAALWPSAQIMFLDIPPRGDRFLAFNSSRMEVNTAIRKVHGVTAINVDDEITCRWQVDACENYQPDNLHFAAGGYRVVAAAIKRAIVR